MSDDHALLLELLDLYKEKPPIKICEKCGVEMVQENVSDLICGKCGIIKEGVLNDNIPMKDSLYSPLHVQSTEGKIIVGSTNNYPKIQRQNTINDVFEPLRDYTGIGINKDILSYAAEYYYKHVQAYAIKRGNVRKGLIAAVVYKMCQSKGVIRKPKEIATIYKVEQKKFSDGLKILEAFINSGIAEPFPEYNATTNFMNRYLSSLGVEYTEKTIQFAERLVYYANKKNISTTTIPSSKCAGIVYLLNQCCGWGLHDKEIKKHCHTSKTTYTKFSNEICEILDRNAHRKGQKGYKTRKQVEHIFDKFYINRHKVKPSVKRTRRKTVKTSVL